MELTKRQTIAKELSVEHWAYIRKVLVHDQLTEIEIERIGFHYREAFTHGFKHADAIIDGRGVQEPRRSTARVEPTPEYISNPYVDSGNI